MIKLSVQVSYKKQFILGIFLVIVLLLMIEGVFQIIWNYDASLCGYEVKSAYFKRVASHEKIQELCSDDENFEYDVNVIRKNKPNQHLNTININSFGFRGEEISLDKPSEEYRIIVVGGSTAFGLGSTNDKTTIPSFLEDKLRTLKNNVKINVINAGIIAATSADEVYYIKTELIDFEPDLFIIFDGYNDSFNVKIKDHELGDTFEMFENRNDFEKFVKKYFKIFATPNVIFTQTHDYMQYLYLTDDIKKRNTEAWVNRWNDLCKTKDFEVMVILQPMLGTSDRILSDSEEKYFGHYKSQKILELWNDLKNSFHRITECNTVYLGDAFDGFNDEVYFSPVHTTDFGNKIIAEKIAEKVLPYINSKVL